MVIVPDIEHIIINFYVLENSKIKMLEIYAQNSH